MINREYYGTDDIDIRSFHKLDDELPHSGIALTKERLLQAMRRIYRNRGYKPGDIDMLLFEAILETFDNAVWQGIDEAEKNGTPPPDNEFIRQLQTNNGVFAAFRTHRLERDMASRMFDDNGRLRSFSAWRKAVAPIADHHVNLWLRTEYDTAVIRAHRAADWKRFERDADVLPNLKWMPSTSVTPGADHRIFWNTVRPIDDPFWSLHRPGDRWNCKCFLSQTDEPETAVPAVPRSDKNNIPAPGLENNPGKDGRIFSENHPYFPSSCSACPFNSKPKLFALFADLAAQKDCEKCRAMLDIVSGRKQRLSEYSEKEWEHTYTPKGSTGFVVTQRERIEEAGASKAEKKKFEKELRMCKVIADNGHAVEYLRGVNRPAGQTYDILMDGIKSDLKCIDGGAGNIVKYAKKALTKQGGEAVIFELPNGDPEFYKQMTTSKNKYQGRIFFYIKDKCKLIELK